MVLSSSNDRPACRSKRSQVPRSQVPRSHSHPGSVQSPPVTPGHTWSESSPPVTFEVPRSRYLISGYRPPRGMILLSAGRYSQCAQTLLEDQPSVGKTRGCTSRLNKSQVPRSQKHQVPRSHPRSEPFFIFLSLA